LIAAVATAKSPLMVLDRTIDWFAENRDGLLIGVAVGLTLVAVMLLARSYGRRVIARDPLDMSWRALIARILAKTTLSFMVLAAADVVATYAELPRRAAHVIDIGFTIAFAIQGAIWGRELILGLIGRRVAEENGSSALASATAIIRVLVSVALFAIAGILILDNLGVNVTALVAGLGIGGIAIGLAAQGIFSDLFAALAILFDKPFKKGDTIRYDNSTGTVERIGLKTTRLRSLTGEQLVMANTKLLEREIHNLAAAKARRMTLYFAVAIDTSADCLAQLSELTAALVAERPGCKFVRCAATGVGSEAIAFEFVYDDKALDNNRVAENRSAILLALVERLRSEKVQIIRASEITPPLAPF
jgi:small-conductance mechanosensitive channel